MKGDIPLDYAVFQLNESRSRCELWICAGEKNEKLAAGSLKPFLAHLRAAKEQIGNGLNFIILQAPPFSGDGSVWFTKKTVEQFVRFVSTPDVLESVTILEAEYQRLVDACSILLSAATGSEDGAPITPRTALHRYEAERSGDQAKTYTNRSSLDYDGVALDGSKRDLLKAIDTRKVMLQNEKKKAFAHALSAGFNVSCISDLMVFANCFGAPRLWEACLNYMTLCKKREAASEEMTLSPVSSGASVRLLSTKSEPSDSSEVSGGSSVTSKPKSRKTWDPQVMSTLQQLYSRKVENACFMSPDVGRRIADKKGKSSTALATEVPCEVNVRKSIEDNRLSVQAAINLFESKQKHADQTPMKKQGRQPTTVTETPKDEGEQGANYDTEDLVAASSVDTKDESHPMQQTRRNSLPAFAILDELYASRNHGTVDDMHLGTTAKLVETENVISNKTAAGKDLPPRRTSPQQSAKAERKVKKISPVPQRSLAVGTPSSSLNDHRPREKENVSPNYNKQQAGDRCQLQATDSKTGVKHSEAANSQIPKRHARGAAKVLSNKSTQQVASDLPSNESAVKKVPSHRGSPTSLQSSSALVKNSSHKTSRSSTPDVQRGTHFSESTGSFSDSEGWSHKTSTLQEEACCKVSSNVEPKIEAKTEEPCVFEETAGMTEQLAKPGSPTSRDVAEMSTCEEHTRSSTEQKSVSSVSSSMTAVPAGQETKAEEEDAPQPNLASVQDLAKEDEFNNTEESNITSTKQEESKNTSTEGESKNAAAEESTTTNTSAAGKSNVEATELVAEEQKQAVDVQITTMDEVVLKWHQEKGEFGKPPPLFELGELDWKMSAATRTPLISLSSSLVDSAPSESTASNIATPTTTKLIPATTPSASSSPAKDRERHPLFDLLVTSSSSSSTKHPCKSSSLAHRLPHMCRLPSPEPARLMHSATHKKLSKSSAGSGSAGSIQVPEKQLKAQPIKGLKRFFRFGRKNGGSSSESKIMWQNGWFKGEQH